MDEYDEMLKVEVSNAARQLGLTRTMVENHQRATEEAIGNLAALRALGPQTDELLKAVLGNQP